MKLCSGKNILLDVCTYDPYQDCSMSIDNGSSVDQLANAIVLPSQSYITDTQDGLAYTYKLQQPASIKQLFKIQMEAESNEIHISKVSDDDRCLYQIVTSIEQLLKDDIIKVGQYSLRVQDIYLANQPTSIHFTPTHFAHKPPSPQICCRICWQKQVDADDPLLSVCQCSGSISHTHYSCMKQWFQKFLIKQQSKNSQYYRYGNANCEICQQEIPYKITHNEIEYSLIQIKHPKQPHILLEIQNKAEVQMICMKFVDQECIVSIGSSEEADLCFDDDLVDSLQAVVKMSGNAFWIENKSKYYHTMIKLRPHTRFTNTIGVNLSCGNLMLCLQAQRGILDWLCPTTTYHLILL